MPGHVRSHLLPSHKRNHPGVPGDAEALELVHDPTITATTGWTLSRFALSGGNFVSDASGIPATATATLLVPLTSGATYTYTFTIAYGTESGDTTVLTVLTPSSQVVVSPTASGTYTANFVASGNYTEVRITAADNATACTLSALSIFGPI